MNPYFQPGWSNRTSGLFLLGAAMAIALPAQTLTTLVNFSGANGANPMASLVQVTDGEFWGTTLGPNLGGTIFKITVSGKLTTVHTFSGSTDGYQPAAPLVQATNGKLYGTTCCGGAGTGGTVFQITLNGTFTTIYSFSGADGGFPMAGLIQGADGLLYGTTYFGGVTGYSWGTVFKITPSGILTTLHSFANSDGAYPHAGLIQAKNGSLYGTTEFGGTSTNCSGGCGTVFAITPAGVLTSLHTFDGTDGAAPYGTLVQDSDGTLYGTTASGGAYSTGTIFAITPGGTLTTIHSLNGADGGLPEAGLVRATNGMFYGTTSAAGPNGWGTIFAITPGGTMTTMYGFSGSDGGVPIAALVEGTNGELYGTTNAGGSSTCTASLGCGTVFSLSVGLGPFIRTLPAYGKVGTNVEILGSKLIGATSVTFNSAAATFTVNPRGTAIATTVPGGATTGAVKVVTPTGTLLSDVPFVVRQ